MSATFRDEIREDTDLSDMEAQARAETASITKTRRAYWLRRYGITEADYSVLSDRQGGVCAICRKPEPRGVLHVDHCHRTGRVRGLLCQRCNTGIGALDDSTDLIRAALAYLEEPGGLQD